MSPRDDRHDFDVERELGLAPGIDDERIAANWRLIVRSRARTERAGGRAPWLVPAFAVLAATAVLVVVLPLRLGAPPTPGPLASRDQAVTVEVGAVVEPAGGNGRAVVLDDGSRVDLEAEARLLVLANDGARFVALLDQGGARFAVTPGGPRRWTIETALATVEVVGTEFRVEPEAHRLVVSVTHGVVLVSGDRVPGRLVRLTAGEQIEITDGATATAPDAPAAPIAPALVAPAAVPPAPAVPPRPTAPALVAPTPTSPPAPPRATEASAAEPGSLSEALAQADQLRADGRAAEAADLLERSLGRYPDDPAESVAAFTLGRIALDALADPDRAAAAFARVIELGSPSSLLESAHARRVDALLRAHRLVAAGDALDAYQAAYPQSRRLAALRARLVSARAR